MVLIDIFNYSGLPVLESLLFCRVSIYHPSVSPKTINRLVYIISEVFTCARQLGQGLR
jgi:hypothetical protein